MRTSPSIIVFFESHLAAKPNGIAKTTRKNRNSNEGLSGFQVSRESREIRCLSTCAHSAISISQLDWIIDLNKLIDIKACAFHLDSQG